MKEPNKLTKETLEKIEKGEGLKSCDSIEELIKELEKDDN